MPRLAQALARQVLRAAAGGVSRPPLPSGRRLLLLHLDGVGRSQLEHALAHGLVPTLQSLLERKRARFSPCRAGAPTSTPAFQAGLLYGIEHGIPGYTWFDKRLGRAVRMDCAEDARRLESDLGARGTPLLTGGSVYCSIFSGGARPRRWALSGWNEELRREDFGEGDLRALLGAALVHSATAGRIAAALGLDFTSGLVETSRWVSSAKSLQHERQFLFHRVLTECLFAEFAANSCVLDVARGVPIVYACFIGYDEYAHRRGPYSALALLKLRELDRALARIVAAVEALPERGYELYLFSDHGQARAQPAESILGESFGEHVLADEGVAMGALGGGETARVAARARWLRRLSRAVPEPLGFAVQGLARRLAQSLDAGTPGAARGPLMIVPAGDIAHLYSTEVPEPLLEEELRARHPGLVERVAHSPAVGFALLRTKAGGVALRGDRRLSLERPEDALALASIARHPLAATYARDLLAMRSAGDLILLGTSAPGLSGDAVAAAFPYEHGSHGGLSPDELDTFMLHPPSLGPDAFADVVRPQDLHRFFLERSGRALGAMQPAA